MFDDLSLKLFKHQNECTFCWVTRDGSPAATVVSYLFDDDCVWMTALEGSGRVRALAKNPAASVVVSGKGSKMGDTRCVSMRGYCEVYRDEETRDWFFPRFSRRVLNKSRMGSKMMSSSMNNASNTVIKFIPEKVIPYDAQKMMKMANFMP